MSSNKTDVDNETSDVLSDTESVEIEEFEEVHTQLIQIQRTQDVAIYLLERIQKQCSTMHEDTEFDLEETIEDLHQKSLITISETGKNPFSSHLLAMIDSIKN
jgi:signal recognition particle GTPase